MAITVDKSGLQMCLVKVAAGLPAGGDAAAFVFRGSYVYTQSEDTLCVAPNPLPGFSGSINSATLLRYLQKRRDDILDVTWSGDGQLTLTNEGKTKAGTLRVSSVDGITFPQVETPAAWYPVPPELSTAMRSVSAAAAADAENDFTLSCVSAGPDYLIATDRSQIARYLAPTGIPEAIVVSAHALKKISDLAVTEVAVTASWLHFKTPDGVWVCTRRHGVKYPDLSTMLNVDPESMAAVQITGFDEVLEMASVLSAGAIIVHLRNGEALVEAAGEDHKHKQAMALNYAGPDVSFCVSPHILAGLCERGSVCRLGKTALLLESGPLTYVAAISSY